jgi:hypothetical protein
VVGTEFILVPYSCSVARVEQPRANGSGFLLPSFVLLIDPPFLGLSLDLPKKNGYYVVNAY